MASAVHNPSRRALLGAAVALPLLPLDGGGRVGVDSDVRRGVSGAEPGPTATPTSMAADRPPDGPLDPPCSSPIEGEGDWRQALVAFEAAAGEVRAFEALCRGRGFEEQEALQGDYDALGEAMEAALGRLLFVPAPDVAALARKMELVLAYKIEPSSDGETGLAAILADARRLAEGEMGASRE
jgi:hypothetical protein